MRSASASLVTKPRPVAAVAINGGGGPDAKLRVYDARWRRRSRGEGRRMVLAIHGDALLIAACVVLRPLALDAAASTASPTTPWPFSSRRRSEDRFGYSVGRLRQREVADLRRALAAK